MTGIFHFKKLKKLVKSLGLVLFLTMVPWLQGWADLIDLSNEALVALSGKSVVLVDIRTSEEWKQTGLIPKSHPLTFFDRRGDYDLKKWLEDLGKIANKDQAIVLICRSGNRSGKVGKLLDEMGQYAKVYHLSQGITHWIDQGNPVKKMTP